MNISFDDLKASNFLYKNGFYPQAIFYLQQTIEKLIKSNGYYLNIIKNRKIGEKNVRHDVWKVYCNILENLSNSKFEKIFNKERQKEIINNSPVLKFLFDKYKKVSRQSRNVRFWLKLIYCPSRMKTRFLKITIN